MAGSSATISGTIYPSWLSAFRTSLGHRILHGCELCNHLWDNLSCMAIILSCMAVNFSRISGILILHGCELFKHLWNNLQLLKQNLEHPILHGWDMAVGSSNIFGILILNGCELFNHLWKKLSCMAVGFSTISGTTYLWHNLELLKHLWGILLAWLSLGCELFKHLWNTYPAWLSTLQKLGTSYPAHL